MQLQEFLERVQHRANLRSPDEAFLASRATLSALAERIGRKEAKDLGPQLPRELATYLLIHEGIGEEPLPFSLDDFFYRVGVREGTDPSVAAEHVRAVFAVLREAISPGEIEDILVMLPEDYRRLFEPGDA